MDILIAKEFSDVPWGRYPEDGDFCGEIFREKHLLPALKRTNPPERVRVNLDGVEGFGSSFLEEAFGGLVRRGFYRPDDLRKRLEVVASKDEFGMYVELIWRYVDEAKFGSEVSNLSTA